MKVILLVMVLSLGVAFFWDSMPIVSETAHSLLDPTLGVFILYNKYLGIIAISITLTLVMTLLQKYTIDRDTMKEIKREQKHLQEELKKHKGHPEKSSELLKRQGELFFEMMPLVMRPAMFTSIPVILLIRWLNDIFGVGGVLEGVKFLGFMSWLWFYILLSVIFSQIFRNVFDVL